MISKFHFSIIGLICLFYFFNVAAAESYQTIYNKCQNGQGACVILNFVKGYHKAEQAPLHLNNLGECADDGSANQICLYKNGGGSQISCGDSDAIEADSNGKKITVIYYGNSKQNFATNGDGTSIFVATCYLKP